MPVYLGLQTTCRIRGPRNYFTRQEARLDFRGIFVVKRSGSNTNIISGKLATVSSATWGRVGP